MTAQYPEQKFNDLITAALAADPTLHHTLHTLCKTNGVGFTAQYQQWSDDDHSCICSAAEPTPHHVCTRHAWRHARQMGWGLSEGRDWCAFNGINFLIMPCKDRLGSVLLSKKSVRPWSYWLNRRRRPWEMAVSFYFTHTAIGNCCIPAGQVSVTLLIGPFLPFWVGGAGPQDYTCTCTHTGTHI